MVKSYNYFPKELYLRSLTRFLIRLSLNKYSLTCSVTLGYVLYETYSEHWHIRNPVYYCKLRHIQVFTLYSDIFRVIMAYSERCVTLAYSKPCHIQSNIQNFGMFRAQGPNSEPCLFGHTQASSIMIVIIILTFTLILHTFQQNFKKQ